MYRCLGKKNLRRSAKRTAPKDRPQGGLNQKKRMLTVTLALALSLSMLCGCGKTDQKVNNISDGPPPMRPPISDPDEPFRKNITSPLLSLSVDYYKGKDTTTVDLDELEQQILSQFAESRLAGKVCELPDYLTVKETENRFPFFTRASSLVEYDEHIYDAWMKLQDLIVDGTISQHQYSNAVTQFHRMGITALNCLDLLSNNASVKEALSRDKQKELKFYYAELAYYGFVNEYVFSPLPEDEEDCAGTGEEKDLYYRCAQIYDHLSAVVAIDETVPPQYYELCLVAAAFLGIAYQMLEEAGFEDIGGEYHSAVWKLEQTMLERLTKGTKTGSGFSERKQAHAAAVPS